MADLSTHLPIPAAYCDPAFIACLCESIAAPELVANFNRLYGATLGARSTPIEQMVDMATGKAKDDMCAFVEFVHFSIYTRLPDEAIHSLRANAFASCERHNKKSPAGGPGDGFQG